MALHRMMVDGVSVSVCCSMDMELYVVVYCVCVVRMGCVFVVRCLVRARKYLSVASPSFQHQPQKIC